MDEDFEIDMDGICPDWMRLAPPLRISRLGNFLDRLYLRYVLFKLNRIIKRMERNGPRRPRQGATI